jgi:hypothetical protein
LLARLALPLPAALAVAACINISPRPTIIVPLGAMVVCPNTSSAVFSDGAHRR